MKFYSLKILVLILAVSFFAIFRTQRYDDEENYEILINYLELHEDYVQNFFDVNFLVFPL